LSRSPSLRGNPDKQLRSTGSASSHVFSQQMQKRATRLAAWCQSKHPALQRHELELWPTILEKNKSINKTFSQMSIVMVCFSSVLCRSRSIALLWPHLGLFWLNALFYPRSRGKSVIKIWITFHAMFTTMVIKKEKQTIYNIYNENQVFKIYATGISTNFPTRFVMFVYFWEI